VQEELFLPHSDLIHSCSNANPGLKVVFKFVDFRFHLFAPKRLSKEIVELYTKFLLKKSHI
jgi:hypothetical protein